MKPIEYGKVASGSGAIMRKGGYCCKKSSDAIKYGVSKPSSDHDRRPNK